jgi:hypothetical protein
MRVRIDRDRHVKSEYRYKFVVNAFYGVAEALVYRFDNGPDSVPVELQEGSEVDITILIAFNMHYRVHATYQDRSMVYKRTDEMRPCTFCREDELLATI